MKILTDDELKELKQQELKLFKEIRSVFDENGIRFFALHGTLLGTIRHNGFIPWDDDIDLGIPRPDYDFLLENFSKLFPSNIGLITPDTKHYEVMFAKIHNKNTTYVEVGKGRRFDRYTGVFIDIFPIDGAPNNEKEQEKYKRKYQKYLFLNYKNRFDHNDVTETRAKLLHILFAPMRALLPYDYFYKKYKKEIYRFSYKNSKCVTYPSVIFNYNYIFDKELFEHLVKHPFEDTWINIPSGYEHILTQVYGDFMKLPPKEKRIPHHYVDYISFTMPYEEYIKKSRRGKPDA